MANKGRRPPSVGSRLWRPVEHGDGLGETVQRLLAGDGKSVGATADAIEPAVDAALQDRRRRGNARHNAQFAQAHRSSRSECPDAAQRVLAISSDDGRSVAATDVQIAPPSLEFAE
jgi:hypothetical protein